ncbi:metal ABC transporter permease [Neorhizobium alkalisoli]|uniref:Zinc transport system permease protein n=1 Tax=Neorhizobium alkalisoli TaxID=528178 RepID=A0A561Q842_9HYPH|nr:metal ABC transporter permease [Neorhizobium alkalisoli]TWF46528.1 zinc transport system permease protein [Neorhizobium alkalisoli]
MTGGFEAFRQWLQALAAGGYLPPSLGYGFAVNALLAGLIAGPMLGFLGTLVVVKRHAFFSEAVGHAALTGVAIGILAGEPYTSPYGSLFGYCLIFGFALNYLRHRTGLSPDTLIGVFLSMSLALGASVLLVLAGRINVHILENVLFGSILTVSGTDITILAIIGLIVVTMTAVFFNRFMLASFNPMLASVRGIPVKVLDYAFVILVTIVTVACVKIIGAVLVGALLVIPAAGARIVSKSLKGFVALSTGFALVATIAGILVPMETDLPVPSGAAIILAAGCLFIACAVLRTLIPSMRGESQ